MRFIFLGSGAIAKACLDRYLAEFCSKADMAGICAPQPLLDYVQRNWGGQKVPETLELNSTERNETRLLDLVKSLNPDFMISVQYPWILSAGILASSGRGVLNLHNAGLPEYRGHNTISHEILNGETVHISCLHWMAEEVDRGVLALTARLGIDPDDTAYSLWKRSVAASEGMFAEFMRDCADIVARRAGTPIAPGGRFYSKNGIARLKEIPANAPVEQVDRVARAFWFPPHEPAYFMHGGRKLYVLPKQFNYSVDQ